MKNTNTKAFKATVFKYLIDAMYDVDDMTDSEKVKHLRDKFNSEFNFRDNAKRYGSLQEMISQYFQGLPINVDCYNGRILEVAAEWHGVDSFTDRQQDTIVNNWFNFLAFKCIQMFKAYDVELPELQR